MTKATPQVQIAPAAPPNPIVEMINPGRRALGETWSKVTVHWDPDERAYIVRREDTEAPADGKPIFVPALGNLSAEMLDDMVEMQRKEAEYRARKPQGMSREERFRLVNEQWHAFVEQKLRWFRGQSQIGPGGMSQRERLVQRDR